MTLQRLHNFSLPNPVPQTSSHDSRSDVEQQRHSGMVLHRDQRGNNLRFT